MTLSNSLPVSRIPRFAAPATERESNGAALADVAKQLGWTQLPWHAGGWPRIGACRRPVGLSGCCCRYASAVGQVESGFVADCLSDVVGSVATACLWRSDTPCCSSSAVRYVVAEDSPVCV